MMLCHFNRIEINNTGFDNKSCLVALEKHRAFMFQTHHRKVNKIENIAGIRC